MNTEPTKTTTTSTPPTPFALPPPQTTTLTKRKHNNNKNTANTNTQTPHTQPNEHTDTTKNPNPTKENYIAIRTTNTALMSYIKRNEDIREVTEPKSQKGIPITPPHGMMLVKAPIEKTQYLADNFYEDVGTPRAELANKLLNDLKNKTPPPEKIATDPNAAERAPERGRMDNSR
jgi:hypothetical protein